MGDASIAYCFPGISKDFWFPIKDIYPTDTGGKTSNKELGTGCWGQQHRLPVWVA